MSCSPTSCKSSSRSLSLPPSHSFSLRPRAISKLALLSASNVQPLEPGDICPTSLTSSGRLQTQHFKNLQTKWSSKHLQVPIQSTLLERRTNKGNRVEEYLAPKRVCSLSSCFPLVIRSFFGLVRYWFDLALLFLTRDAPLTFPLPLLYLSYHLLTLIPADNTMSQSSHTTASERIPTLLLYPTLPIFDLRG